MNAARTICTLILALLCVSCAAKQENYPERSEIFRVPVPLPAEATRPLPVAPPVFLIERADKPYNRIGMPAARLNADNEPEIFVNPERAAIFFERQTFYTLKDRYLNLIFRVHFEKVPFSPDEPHLVTGNNVGLLAVITLDRRGRPLLLTTVHTCGCYLAFFPFPDLPREALPPGWPVAEDQTLIPTQTQKVYGITLPAHIRQPFIGGEPAAQPAWNAGNKLLITLRHGDHRVKNVRGIATGGLDEHRPINPMQLLPMDQLQRLPYGANRTQKISFFEQRGPRRGLVRDCAKPLERLFMSWWTMDWNIGVDKDLGDPEETGTIFYTSVKFWRRGDSNMWNFSDFLSYWGWNL